MGERCGVYMVECVLSREVEISSGREVRSVWWAVVGRGRWRYRVGERCGVNSVEWMGEGSGDIECERGAECLVGSRWEREVEISSGRELRSEW